MTERTFFFGLIIAWVVLAVTTFILLFFVTAPYGRHTRRGWGPTLPNRLGWLFMEAPSAIIVAVCFAAGAHKTPTAWVFLAMWEAHYIHRAFIYPWMLHDGRKRMPFSVMGMAIFFNTVNGYLNGRWIFSLSDGYPTTWLLDPRFLAGLALFITGFVINRRADEILRHLRERSETGYKIPLGGLYRYVSSPNYLGEIIEWFGWAVATWSLAGLTFAIWTAANLAPRARANHRWYREKFPEYPPDRKALVPGLW